MTDPTDTELIALSNWLGAAVGAEIKKHGSDAATPKNKGLVK